MPLTAIQPMIYLAPTAPGQAPRVKEYLWYEGCFWCPRFAPRFLGAITWGL